ncbi:hypothetical protein AAFF_G00399970 [Aldrovandia affinis]|uniref:Uncharacterized protein n=1 Tax=Aldrovandia affinis TaxID=143900 RepID=A0AAD7R3X7_9TELE|nr:hypothetical protein AAFF_G00399970 [Aldrovandia affinis]
MRRHSHASGSPSSTGASKLSSALSSADVFQRLLVDFPTSPHPFSSAAVKHGVDHFIATTGPPVHARARRLDPQKLAVAKAEFDSMERLGIVRRSSSPWASPLHLVPKTGGGDLAGTIDDLMTPRLLTATLYRTYRISRLD